MTGKRIAVYGLGRSGLAVARAAVALGAVPVVYDKANPEEMVKGGLVEAVRELGVEMHLGWDGRFDPRLVDTLVPNPGVDSRSEILRQAVADGIEIVSEIEFAYRVLEFRQSSNTPTPQRLNAVVPIVAITGTNGKSTTTVMTYLAMRECGINAVLCGNVFGTGYPEITLTEAAMNAKPGQVLVAEVSSFQLEWVSRFRPAVAGITNITPDHLDRYDSFEDYAAAKRRIFIAQQREDYAVIDRGIGFQPMSASGFQPEDLGLEGPGTHRLEGDATKIEKRQGANLPHWTAEHGTYAVRFRLADSAPASVAAQWQAERREIEKAVETNLLSPKQLYEAERLLSLRVDRFLDGGQGACLLRRPEVAEVMRSSLEHFDGQRYRVHAWCVMPNHVHVLVTPFEGFPLEQILHSWKSFSANKINRLLRRTGPLWQSESYDHLVRDSMDFASQRAYILGNPEAARLLDWPWRASGFQPEDQGLEGPGTHRLEGDATRTGPPNLGAVPHTLTFGIDGEHGRVSEGEIRILDRALPTSDMQVIGSHNYINAAMAGLMAYATLVWLIGNIEQPFSSARMMSMARIVDAEIDHRNEYGRRAKPAEGKQTRSHDPQSSWALPDCIVTALKNFRGIEHRTEFVGERNGVKVVNNSMCTNPEAVVSSARAIAGPLHLLMGGKDKELPFDPVRNYLAGGSAKAYLYGEAKDLLNTQLGGGFPTYNTLQDAFRAATEMARPGETIMLAPGCASMDQFHDFRDRGNVFKQIAMEWLNS